MTRWETLDALSHQFELCEIGPDTAVVALLSGDGGPMADIVRAALARTRADVVDVRPLTGSDALAGQLGDIVADADVVIDALATPLVTDVIPDVQVLRILPIALEAERYPPHAHLESRIGSLLNLLQHGRKAHLSDRYGTDLWIGLGDGLYAGDAGRPLAGTIARYPAGWLELVPGPMQVEGDLILLPGDGNITRGTHLGSPVRLTIREDRITSIDGDNPDADTLRSLFEHFDDPDAYGFAGLVVGANAGGDLNPAPFDPRLVDDEVARFSAGVVQVAFGDNEHADRPCRGTIDLALARRTLKVDETLVVDDGDLVGEVAPDIYERLS